jgi:long-chain acyl-CoA synthetase
VYQDEEWTFGEVMRQVDALGAALVHDFGIKKGDRVAIAMRNLPEWVVSFAAVLSIGAISVSLNAWWTEDELAYGLEDSGASVLLADPERVERSRAACERLGVAVIGARLGDGGAGAGAGAGDDSVEPWEDIVAVDRPLPEVELDPEDDATILYTSGTTGRPKGAVSTHGAVVQALFGFGCSAMVQSTRRKSDDADVLPAKPVFILVVPLFHVTGCVPVMLSCFFVGMKLVMMRKWDPEEALRLIERERVTNFVGVPTQSWDLLECPRFAEFDTSSLASVGGGGAPAPPTLVRRVDDEFSGGRPHIGYGMTETNAYGPQNFGEDYLTHPTSAGRALPILEVEIRDESDRPLPVGERGEICMKGPNLIRGYWGRDEDTAETIVDGWLRSGDVGRIDEDGFLYVEDRAKDMVLRAGENIYCAEVEAAIYEHAAVYEVAVLGLPHERLGEEVAAVVCLREGETLRVDELQAHVAERLAAFKVPAHIVFISERLPRSASGKILKRELRQGLLG